MFVYRIVYPKIETLSPLCGLKCECLWFCARSMGVNESKCCLVRNALHNILYRFEMILGWLNDKINYSLLQLKIIKKLHIIWLFLCLENRFISDIKKITSDTVVSVPRVEIWPFLQLLLQLFLKANCVPSSAVMLFAPFSTQNQILTRNNLVVIISLSVAFFSALHKSAVHLRPIGFKGAWTTESNMNHNQALTYSAFYKRFWKYFCITEFTFFSV